MRLCNKVNITPAIFLLLTVFVFSEARSFRRQHVKALAMEEDDKDIKPVTSSTTTPIPPSDEEENDSTEEDDGILQPPISPQTSHNQEYQQANRLTRSKSTSCEVDSERKVEETQPKLAQLKAEEPSVTDVDKDEEVKEPVRKFKKIRKSRRPQKSNTEAEAEEEPKSNKIETTSTNPIEVQEKSPMDSEKPKDADEASLTDNKTSKSHKKRRTRKHSHSASTTTTTSTTTATPESHSTEEENEDEEPESELITTPVPEIEHKGEDSSHEEDKDKEPTATGPLVKAVADNQAVRKVEKSEGLKEDEEEVKRPRKKSRRSRHPETQKRNTKRFHPDDSAEDL